MKKKLIDKYQKGYPIVTIKEEPWAEIYFKRNPSVSGMAIGGGMNGIQGQRRVILNPFISYNKKAVLQNERLRHWMDESNFKLPNVSKQQLNKYIGTPYENDTLNIGRTEAARYLTGDKHLLNKEQMNYIDTLNIPIFKQGGIHIKKQNRGKFTEYCNGKVTQECIDKAKRSGNKKLIKRAVFAENSRKWAKKHSEGGFFEKVFKSILPSKSWVEKVMKASNVGNIGNLHDYWQGKRNWNTGSRIHGEYLNYTPLIVGIASREPAPNKDRDLVSQYLYQKSSLIPIQNPTPITVDGQNLTGEQFEGQIFTEDNINLPESMHNLIDDYISNKKLIALNNNIHPYMKRGKTYDNVRSHYISFKKDEHGNVYADIFDRWDMDHSPIIGNILDKYYGKPFILRQKVPVKFSKDDLENGFGIDYLYYNIDPNLNKNNKQLYEQLEQFYNQE